MNRKESKVEKKYSNSNIESEKNNQNEAKKAKSREKK